MAHRIFALLVAVPVSRSANVETLEAEMTGAVRAIAERRGLQVDITSQQLNPEGGYPVIYQP